MFADVRRHLSRAPKGDATHEEGDGGGHGVKGGGGVNILSLANWIWLQWQVSRR